MKRYASCSKILEDIRTLRADDGIFIAELLESMKRAWPNVFGYTLTVSKSPVAHLTRRSEGPIWRDDKGGVYFFVIFLKNAEKNSRFHHFCPLNIATRGTQ